MCSMLCIISFVYPQEQVRGYTGEEKSNKVASRGVCRLLHGIVFFTFDQQRVCHLLSEVTLPPDTSQVWSYLLGFLRYSRFLAFHFPAYRDRQ